MRTLQFRRYFIQLPFSLFGTAFFAACTAPPSHPSNAISVPISNIYAPQDTMPPQETPDIHQSPYATSSATTLIPNFDIRYSPAIVSFTTLSSTIATISNTADWYVAFAGTVQSNYGYLSSLRFTKKGTMPNELITDTRLWHLRQVEQCCTVRDGAIRGGTTFGGTNPLSNGVVNFPEIPNKIYIAFTKDILAFGLLVKINKNCVSNGMTLGFDIATGDFEVAYSKVNVVDASSKSLEFYKWPNIHYVGLPLSGQLTPTEIATSTVL